MFASLNWLRLVLGLALCLFLAAPAMAQDRVLLVSSYHPGFPTFLLQIDGLKTAFAKNDVLLDVEYMDSKRFFSPEWTRRFHESLSAKLRKVGPYDVVVTADDNALNYVESVREELFPDTPIVFFGVNDQEHAHALSSHRMFTGVIEATSMQATIDMIWDLLPATNTVHAIVDSTPSGQSDLKQFLNLELMYPDKKLKVISLSKMTWKDFAYQLALVPREDALLLLSAYRDRGGVGKRFVEGLEVILNSAHAPVFHLWEHGLGDGILGGKVISQFEQGRIAGSLILAILKGKPPGDIPVVSGEAANKYVVDHEVMVRFNIPNELLPETIEFRNKPSGFYDKYRVHVLLVAGCAVILLPISIMLIIIVLRLRESKVALETSNARLRVLFEESPLGMILFDEKGEIIDCNDNFVEIMGSSRHELIGFNSALDSTPQMRKAIARALGGIPAVYEGEYTSITGNKSSFIRVRFNPVLTNARTMQVIATLEDIGRSPKHDY